MARKSGRKKKVTLPKGNWDHGTETQAATVGTVIEPITDENGRNPNNRTRRRRRAQSDMWRDRLSMRQHQAAVAIENAHERVQALGSGGDSIGRMILLQTQVDASPKPDATIDVQTGARSHLVHVMRPVPKNMRDIIEHLFWHNLPMRDFVQGREYYDRSADVKVALDLVANHLRY